MTAAWDFSRQYATDHGDWPTVAVLVGDRLHEVLVEYADERLVTQRLVLRDREHRDVLRFGVPGSGRMAMVLSSPQLNPWAYMVLNQTLTAGDEDGPVPTATSWAQR